MSYEYRRERSRWLSLRLRPLERCLLDEAARRHGETVSAFARSAALEAARRILGDQDAKAARPGVV